MGLDTTYELIEFEGNSMISYRTDNQDASKPFSEPHFMYGDKPQVEAKLVEEGKCAARIYRRMERFTVIEVVLIDLLETGRGL